MSDPTAGLSLYFADLEERLAALTARVDELETTPTPTPDPHPPTSVGWDAVLALPTRQRGPVATTPPAGAVVIGPADNFAAACDQAASGSKVLYLTAGVYQRASKYLSSRHNDLTIIGAKGAVLDGGGSVAEALNGTAAGVTVRNLEIRNYVPGNMLAAVKPYNGPRWTIEDCWVHDCRTGGVYLTEGSTARRNIIERCGQSGVRQQPGAAGVTVTDNEIGWINQANAYDYTWDAGAMKLAVSKGSKVAGNWVHDINGAGLWWDINCTDAQCQGNLIERVGFYGIFYEISWGTTVIDSNVVRHVNDGPRSSNSAGIFVSTSQGVTVTGNLVEDCPRGIVSINQSRTDQTPSQGAAFRLADLRVDGNTVNAIDGLAGAVWTPNGTPSNVVWRNTAYDDTSGQRWDYQGLKTFPQWQAAGFDV